MQKQIIAGVGFSAVVLGVLLAGLYVQAAIGDAQYAKYGARVTISGGDIALGKACASATLGGIQVNKLDDFRMRQVMAGDDAGKFFGRGMDLQTWTSAQLLDLELAGDLGGRVFANAPNWDVRKHYPTTGWAELDAAAKTACDTFTESKWGADITVVRWMRLWVEGGTVYGRLTEIVTDTPDQWAADKAADPTLVMETYSKVTE